ncbi:hypothetical protein LX87_05176 [Larkinella arboricola]|uniref:Uncharacterized protein n=1 Tax=Larkinella arboricola TaxID=643671 RepID=A0A327WN02_LARAB|nr:hypothetical protein [Larkinella arboricola]RAJ92208.1 hypothetical protein LX87_05176 [Larkinella arboricola]
MIIGDLKSYINYFKAWADASPEVKFFCFGSVEKGIEFARSLPDFDYPFAWLEQPILQPWDNGAGHLCLRYNTGFTILQKAPQDENEKQIDAYAESLALLTDLMGKLMKDNNKGLIHFDLNSLKIESVNQLWIDSHYGFRMEVQLDLNINSRLFK